jgi:hypothetical protein
MPCHNPRRNGWWISAALKDSCKWVGAFHQQLENQYGKTKQIMFRSAVKATKAPTLQFKWRKVRCANGTAVDNTLLVITHLKRVGIN